jgi:hypothetical protein
LNTPPTPAAAVSALPLSCPETDRSLQGERRARPIRWVTSMSGRGEIIF